MKVLVVNLGTNVATMVNASAQLTPRCAEILFVLNDWIPEVISWEELSVKVYGSKWGDKGDSALINNIPRLRKMLAKGGLPIIILGDRTVGFSLQIGRQDGLVDIGPLLKNSQVSLREIENAKVLHGRKKWWHVLDDS